MDSATQAWYKKLTELASSQLRVVPELASVYPYFERSLSPEQAYAELFPEQGVEVFGELQEEPQGALDISDVGQRSESELADIAMAEGIPLPRVTEQMVMSKIVNKTFTRMPSGRTIICEITMRNGYTARGECSAVIEHPDGDEVAKAKALSSAVRAAWPLEAYLLRESIYLQGLRERTAIEGQ